MPPPGMRALTAAVCAAVIAGCGDPAREPAGRPPDPTARPPAAAANVAKPDPHRIAFDESTRTLTLYELPDEATKWLLHVPGQMKGVPVNLVHQFMGEVNLDAVAVSHTTAAGAASPRLTLREVVEAAKESHAKR